MVKILDLKQQQYGKNEPFFIVPVDFKNNLVYIFTINIGEKGEEILACWIKMMGD